MLCETSRRSRQLGHSSGRLARGVADQFRLPLEGLPRSAARRQGQHRGCSSHGLFHSQECEFEIHPQQVSPHGSSRLGSGFELLSTHQRQFATFARTRSRAVLDHSTRPQGNDSSRGPDHFAGCECQLHPQGERAGMTCCTRTRFHRYFPFGLRLRSLPYLDTAWSNTQPRRGTSTVPIDLSPRCRRSARFRVSGLNLFWIEGINADTQPQHYRRPTVAPSNRSRHPIGRLTRTSFAIGQLSRFSLPGE